MFHIGLNCGVVKSATDETFGIEHCVVGVHCHLDKTEEYLFYSFFFRIEMTTVVLKSHTSSLAGKRPAIQHHREITHLILGCITDQTFCVREGHVTGGCSVTLVVGDDFHLAVLKHSDARVRGPQVDSYCWSLGHCVFQVSGMCKDTQF